MKMDAVINDNDDSQPPETNISRSQSSENVFFCSMYMPEFSRFTDDDDGNDDDDGSKTKIIHLPNNHHHHLDNILKVPSKMYLQDINYRRLSLNRQILNNRETTLSSRCSTQSSSTSSSGGDGAGFRRNSMTPSGDPSNRGFFNHGLSTERISPFFGGSSSSLTTIGKRRFFTNGRNSFKNSSSHTSLIEAAEKFNSFIECYELSLIECLSIVEPDEAMGNYPTTSNGGKKTDRDDDDDDDSYKSCISFNNPVLNATDHHQQQQTNKHQTIMAERNVLMINEEREDNSSGAGAATDNGGGHCGPHTKEIDGGELFGRYRHNRAPYEKKLTTKCGFVNENDRDKRVLEQATKAAVRQVFSIESLNHNDQKQQQEHVTGTDNGKVNGGKFVSEVVSAPVTVDNGKESHTGLELTGTKQEIRCCSLQSQLDKLNELRQEYLHSYQYQLELEQLSHPTRDTERKCHLNKRKLATIEQQLETLIGSFCIRVERLEGWARICPRDVYEIEFRHGKKREVLRVRIGKSLEREWDGNRREASFSGSLDPKIICHVREIKNGWGNLLPSKKRHLDVGITEISVFEFLKSAVKNLPVMLEANPSGTIKLRMVCHWQPHGDARFGDDCLPLKEQQSKDTLPIAKHTETVEAATSGANNAKNEMKASLPVHPSQISPPPVSSHKLSVNQHSTQSLTLPTYILNVDNDAVANFGDVGGRGDKATTLPSKNTITNDGMSSSHLPPPPPNSSSIGPLTWNDPPPQLDYIYYDDFDEESDFGPAIYSDSSSAGTVTDDEDEGNESPDDCLSVGSIRLLLARLRRSMRDCAGQTIEITHLSQSVQRCSKLFHIINQQASKQNLEQSNAVDAKELRSQEEESSSSHIAHHRTISFFDESPHENWTDWNKLLLHHLSSALKQLNHMGAWILKSRERLALMQLQIDTFAINHIYEIILLMMKHSNGDTSDDDERQQQQRHEDQVRNALGNDLRVLEIWNFMRRMFPNHRLFRLRYTRHQLSTLMSSLILKYDLMKTATESKEEIDEIIQDAGRWLVDAMAGTDHFVIPHRCGPLTLFTIRAFFELGLYKHYQSCQIEQQTERQPALRNFLQIAIDLNRWIRMKTTSTVSLSRAEQVLRGFSINCHWIPAYLTLKMVIILYKYHLLQESKRTNTTTKPEMAQEENTLRKVYKIINNWLSWQLQDSRFEIRDHIIAGLESPSTYVRCASCYGILCLIRVLDRIEDKKRHHQNLPPVSANDLWRPEANFLMFVSMHDQSEEVRKEARRSLKCYGDHGRQRLENLERIRMGFSSVSSSSSPSVASVTLDRRGSQQHDNQGQTKNDTTNAAGHQKPTSNGRTSMPNLKTSQWIKYEIDL